MQESLFFPIQLATMEKETNEKGKNEKGNSAKE
jgi:hypothetical protein